MYKQQARLQSDLLREEVRSRAVAVGTVDSFQGSEEDLIIVDLVRSVSLTNFINDVKRVNVSLTRAYAQEEQIVKSKS